MRCALLRNDSVDFWHIEMHPDRHTVLSDVTKTAALFAFFKSQHLCDDADRMKPIVVKVCRVPIFWARAADIHTIDLTNQLPYVLWCVVNPEELRLSMPIIFQARRR